MSPALLIAAAVVLLFRPSAALIHLRATPLSFTFLDAPARFAVPIEGNDICGALSVADPVDGCAKMWSGNGSSGGFVLVVRGGCSFEEKVRNAQEAGFGAAVVYDDKETSSLYSMIGDSSGIHIHAVFVSKMAGETLKKFARGEDGECCIEPSMDENTGTMLVISFVSLIVVFSVLASFMSARNSHFLRHGSNNKPPSMKKEVVEVLPRFTFSAAFINSKSTTETCAICLQDYMDGETLRILPCQHDFHLVCVDSWLTKWGTCCPVCKHEVSSK